MLNRYFFIGAFVLFLAVFSFFMFWSPQEDESKNEIKEIKWIHKPSFVLLKELKSNNPVIRREAIIKLGEKRSKRALVPLFYILKSNAYPLFEKQLAAKSVALIKGRSIIPVVFKFLKTPNLGHSETLSMLYILKNVQMGNKPFEGEDFSVLNDLLNNDKENEVVLATIQVIENLGYWKSFYQLSKVYKKKFFYKVASLKAMNKLALKQPQLKGVFRQFLNQIMWSESHDSIQQAIRESLFTLHFNRFPKERESYLISLISNLRSSSYIEVFRSEQKFLKLSELSDYIQLFNFFLNDKNPKVVNRLASLLLRKKFCKGLEENLETIIRRRFSSSNKDLRPIYLDTAVMAMELLSYSSDTENYVKLFQAHIQDPYLGESALSALNNLYKQGKEKEIIEKRAPFYLTAITAKKHYLIPLLKLLINLRDFEKIKKLAGSWDSYIRNNTINELIKSRQPDLEKIALLFKNSQDPVVRTLLKNY